MNKFYNSFFKSQFLDTLNDRAEKNLFSSLFNTSSKTEYELNKDIYNFNDKEIEILLYSFETPSKNTMTTYLSLCRKYVDYAIETGYRISNINIYRIFTHDKLSKYILPFKNQFVTYDEFNMYISMLYNHSDRALMRAIFNGVKGYEYSEISNLTINDLKEAKGNPTRIIDGEQYYKIKLHSALKNSKEVRAREIEIPDTLFRELEDTYYEDAYYSNNGESQSRVKAIELMEGEYVFRNIKYKKTTPQQIDKQVIYRRAKLLNSLTDGAVKSISTTIDSGILYHLSLLAVDNKLKFNDCVKAFVRFDLSVQKSLVTSTKYLLEKYEEPLQNYYGVTVIEKP